MKNIIFIASYPKSGNTWIRIIISLLIYASTVSKIKNLKKFDFEKLKGIGIFSQLKYFKNIEGYKLQDDGLLDSSFTINNWINAQKIINKNSKINFFKTHNMGGKINGKNFTNSDVCGGFIYITRDPRDIAISKAKYMNTSIDVSIDRMLNDTSRIIHPGKVIEYINTWENHVLSWYGTKTIPRLMLKYEEMLFDPRRSIKEIIKFINMNTNLIIKNDEETIDYVAKNADFISLQSLEAAKGFKESTIHSKFFRKGKSKQWEGILTSKQTYTIKKNYNYLWNILVIYKNIFTIMYKELNTKYIEHTISI